ncbi:MAG: hydrogenase maturation nickel metallochaperone HypA [Firmicutes bacterium]|nr:hydrogenase maturation nickel metallochaperone HypA [Bacillota bacterium]
MHEASLMENILRSAQAALASYRVDRVNALYVRAGKMANVMPHALQFAFQSQTESGLFAGAVLHLQIEPVSARCRRCGLDYQSEIIPLTCPACASHDAEITGGDSVYLSSIDFDGEEI